jgi:DNA-binding NarL/FixJ family response regulator
MQPWLERSKAIVEATAARDQPLSKRELEVAQLVSQGLSNRNIAERLHLSERTAESHVKNICDKLGFNSRAQVAAWVAARKSSTEIQ